MQRDDQEKVLVLDHLEDGPRGTVCNLGGLFSTKRCTLEEDPWTRQRTCRSRFPLPARSLPTTLANLRI